MAATPPTVQAQAVTYDFHSLGWKSFQDLCSTIVSFVLGHTVQVFLPNRDGGRDGAFHGTWRPGSSVGVAGSFTVQCKFTSQRTKNLSLVALEDEITKVERLASRGLADNYILMTNYALSAKTEEQIREAFLNIPGIKAIFVFGIEWLTQKIRENPQLRMLVPRVYGLGDLSQILDARAYIQAQDILSTLGDDLSKFVLTHAHRRSATALVEHGFVLLLGEPASGKSTIAASLALGAADIWKCSTIKLRDAREFVAHWNPEEPRQFFWVDDAFGTTQYQREVAYEWNRTFSHMHAAIKKGARVLFTSRDYIYGSARNDLKTDAFPLLEEAKVVINVQQLSISEKEQIVYNHLKLGNQSKAFRKRIKQFLPQVARIQHFLPETARRLGHSLFTTELALTEEGVRQFVEEPVELLTGVLRNLDSDSRAALALIFMNGGSLNSPIELRPADTQSLALLGVSFAEVRVALNALDGSLVRLVRTGGAAHWTFRHPTVGDALAGIIASDPELVDIYLAGTSTERILQEVTCGQVAIEGAKVVVPRSRYLELVDRIGTINNRQKLYVFLAFRSDDEFLRLYVERYHDLCDLLTSAGAVVFYPGVAVLINRLRALGLFSLEHHAELATSAREYVIENPDAEFLTNPIYRALLTGIEIEAIVQAIRTDLLPYLDDTIATWRSNYDTDQSAEDYFQPLRDTLTAFGEELASDSRATTLIQAGLKQVNAVVEEIVRNTETNSEEEYEYMAESVDKEEEAEMRSIFDDVDE